jgi:hypothetical protein
VPHALTTIWLYRLPSLFGAVKAPLTYMLEMSEAAAPASDAV